MTAYEMRISDWSADVCSSDLSSPDRPDDVAGIDADGFPVGSHRSLVLLPADVGSVGSIGFDFEKDRDQRLSFFFRELSQSGSRWTREDWVWHLSPCSTGCGCFSFLLR